MCRYIRMIAVVANLIGLAFLAFFMLTEIHRTEQFLILLAVAIVPALSLLALREGPDQEERMLLKQVRKARLHKELKDLEKSTK